MSRGRDHLLVFLTGLFVLAAVSWLVAWATGLPMWSQFLVSFTTLAFGVMMLVAFFSEGIDAAQRFALGPIRMNDDRGTRVALRFVNAELDRAERGALSKFKMPGVARVMLSFGGGFVILMLGVIVVLALSIPQPWIAIGALFVVIQVAQSRVLDHVEQRGHAHGYLHLGRCGACGYSLRGLPPEDDGCQVCSECGAAWKLRESHSPSCGKERG